MMKLSFFKSLNNKLFGWYIGSLIILSVFFYVGVHILAIPRGTELFFLLFFLLAIIGFAIIYNITNDLTYLTKKIKEISHENLRDRIVDIKRDDELGELATAFNNLLNRLDEAFKREQQFIGDVAHELKTPIATMRSALEVAISKDRSNDEYKKVIHDSIIETNHISSTLKNVLDLAWSETPHEQKHFVKLNLSKLTTELIDIADKLASSRLQNVRSNVSSKIYINGYEERLARGIINIIENAIKYTPPKGIITVQLSKKNDRAVLTVRDTGQGILATDIPHIFDRFYRGSTTDNVFGSGIGLSITKSIVNLHHGSIDVKSQPGKGTIFTIKLPLSEN